MSWKKYKNIFSALDHPLEDESKFILGIDIGSKTTVISFWNVNRKEPEIIDMSGGYGKPSIPTILQYIPENKEWVFGEYALLNRGYFEDITITDLINKLGSKELIDVENRSLHIPFILGKYIREITETCKNINPNGEIIGIIAAIPTYFSREAKAELYRSFTMAGFDKELITLLTDRECILRYLYAQDQLGSNEKILYMDYGNQCIKGGILEVDAKDTKVQAHSISSIFAEEVGGYHIDQLLKNKFLQYYCEEMGLLKESVSQAIIQQVEIFVYQNKTLLFQNYYQKKATKLYFNFAYPAFQKNIEVDEMDKWMKPIKSKLADYATKLITKTVYGKIDQKDIHKIILTGGGFEMSWARELILDIFQDAQVVSVKNPETIVSLGACMGAASYLGIIPELEVDIKDQHQLEMDIGVKVIIKRKEQFIPLIERNSFWWQEHTPKVFILNHLAHQEPEVHLLKRNYQGEVKHLYQINLKALSERPPRTTRLKFALEFIKPNQIQGIVKDEGFGEIFPATGYQTKFDFEL